MAWILFQDKKRPAQKFYYDALDGDTNDLAPAVEMPPDFDEEIAGPNPGRWGVPLKPDNIPTRLVRIGQTKNWWDVDIFKWGLVSEKFKSLIERFEPGVHQFWPMQIENRKGDVLATYYWFIICNRIDSLDRDLCQPEVKRIWIGVGHGSFNEGARLVLRSAEIGKRHIWREVRPNSSTPFASDALAAAIAAEGLTGYSPVQVEEV